MAEEPTDSETGSEDLEEVVDTPEEITEGDEALADAEPVGDTDSTDDLAATDPVGTSNDDAGTKTQADEDTKSEEAESEKAESKSDKTEKPAAPVVRRKVVSKRVTPKGGGPARSSGPATKAKIAEAEQRQSAKRRKKQDHDWEDETFGGRYTPPSSHATLPSPWWVPAIMFGLLVIGALIIMLNYMGTFGDPANWRLLVGLGFILGGIITATQLR